MKKEPLVKITYRDPEEGFEGYLVIDTLVDGLCGGGLRVSNSVDLVEVERLARGMTLKNSVMQLPLGGAKSAIRYDPLSPNLQDALIRFFKHVGPMCSKMYGWGPDLNTPPDLCDAVADGAGFKSRHMALAEKSEYGYEGVERYNKALRRTFGPLTITNARTAIGVTGATEMGAKVCGLPSPFTFAVQGFGSVGAGTVHFLSERGHRPVGVADAGGYYHDADGLVFADLQAAQKGQREINKDKLDARLHGGAPNNVLEAECDVLILAAIPDAVGPDDVPRLKCKMIVEGGNFAVAPAAHAPLQERGIHVVPDFIASGGGIATVSGIIQLGWSDEPAELLREIESRVSAATERAATAALEKGISIREAGMPGA